MVENGALLICYIASEGHYSEHIEPLIILGQESGKCKSVLPHEKPEVCIVSSYADLCAARSRFANTKTKLVYMEHGAGQSYQGILPSLKNYYAGGERLGVGLVLSPGEACTAAYEAASPQHNHYSGTFFVEIGCPKLANWKGTELGTELVPGGVYPHILGLPTPRNPKIGLSFHWDCEVCPETSATWLQWLPVVSYVKKLMPEWEWEGYCHPRNRHELGAAYTKAGIPISGLNPVEEGCHILLCDNSSLGWEFMCFDRPTLWLDGVQYRYADHGLRFPSRGEGRDVLGPRTLDHRKSVWLTADALIQKIEWLLRGVVSGCSVGSSRSLAALAYSNTDPSDQEYINREVVDLIVEYGKGRDLVAYDLIAF